MEKEEKKSKFVTKLKDLEEKGKFTEYNSLSKLRNELENE